MEFDFIIIFYIISYLTIIGIVIYNDLEMNFISKKSTLRISIITTVLLIIILIFKYYPIEHTKVDTLFSNLFKVSGIIITLFITYLFTKLFNIRNAKEERQKEIKVVANKLTEFRRFIYHFMNSRKFWKNYQEIQFVKIKFKNLTYNDLYQHKENEDPRISDFWMNEHNFSQTRAIIYLASEELVGLNPTKWVLNDDYEITYSMEDLIKYHDPTGTYWYHFDHKYHKFTHGLFDFHELNKDFNIEKMKQHLSNIDSSKNIEFIDRNLISEIGSQIHEKYWPKLYELTKINNVGIPSTLNSLVRIIVLTVIFGVITPLLFSFGEFSYRVDTYGAFISISVIISCLIWILLDFFNIVKNEIKI